MYELHWAPQQTKSAPEGNKKSAPDIARGLHARADNHGPLDEGNTAEMARTPAGSINR